jgi:hypothetical protein
MSSARSQSRSLNRELFGELVVDAEIGDVDCPELPDLDRYYDITSVGDIVSRHSPDSQVGIYVCTWADFVRLIPFGKLLGSGLRLRAYIEKEAVLTYFTKQVKIPRSDIRIFTKEETLALTSSTHQ